MTERRFVPIGVEWTDGFIQDHVGDRDLFNIGAVCKLLNELNDKYNEIKEQYADDCNEANSLTVKITELTEENEQLKSKHYWYKQYKELLNENEQLKQRIKELEQEIEKLDTFKKILEYAENDSDRVDWQSYCERI